MSYQRICRNLRECTVAALAVTVLISTASTAAYAQQIIEEILVTAQKREQNILDVPLSVTAFSGDEMRQLGFTKAVDIALQTPGVTFRYGISDSAPIINIRGISLNDLASNSNSPVSIYVDDVFLPSNIMMNFQLFDLERTEVLKGPQGTLYGRNTTGGALKFISRKPTSEPEAFLDVGYGSWGTLDAEGAISGPLSDSLSGRFSFTTRQRNGGWQDVVDIDGNVSEWGDQDRTSLRIQLLWEASETVEVLLSVHGGYDDSENQIYEHVAAVDPVTFGLCSQLMTGDLAGAQRNCFDFTLFNDDDGDFKRVYSEWGVSSDNESFGASVSINWDLDRVTFTSITAFEEFERKQLEEFDANPAPTGAAEWFDDIQVFSQELRLTSDGSWALPWIVGGYYSTQDHDNSQILELTEFFLPALTGVPGFDPFFDTFTQFSEETTTAALFGHVEWPFADRWQLVAGARYTKEEKDYDGSTTGLECATFPGCTLEDAIFTFPLASLTDVSMDENNISGDVALEFRPNDDWMLYGRYARGFKSGGFSGNLAFSDDEITRFEPEFLDSFEIGAKASLLDGAMQFTTAVFYYEWDDLQNLIVIPVGGISTQILTNAGDAEITGWEAELSWAPTENLLIRGGLAYLDSKIVRSADPSGDKIKVGNRLGNTPDWTFNGVARYTLPSTALGFTPYAQLDFYWQDDVFFDASNKPYLAEDSYGLLNARVGVRSADNRWEAAIWAKNLTDEEYIAYALDLTASGIVEVINGEPRSFGINFIYNFF